MNKTIVSLLLVVSAVIAVVGNFYGQRSGLNSGVSFTSMIGGVFVIAFARMLLLDHLLENRPLKLGSETLPPIKDVASVLVQGNPISDESRKKLLVAIRKAKRAASCGTILKELPFQIVDHWGGFWELEAYMESGGKKGFSANRVYYSGRAAELVAECVGI